MLLFNNSWVLIEDHLQALASGIIKKMGKKYILLPEVAPLF
jgi:hypothetical protein